MATGLGARLILARWLGPWADPERLPEGIVREELHEGDLRAWHYRPAAQAPIGALLMAHGLHFRGPTDPRLDRLCRILAAARIAVLVPFITPYMDLRPAPSLLTILPAALRLLLQQPTASALASGGGRPGVFSISFGSLPALHLAADPAYAHQIGGLVVFGGYADWDATMRYVLDGSNPLNQPVAFLNLLDDIDAAEGEADRLREAWRRYVLETWPHPDMKRPERHGPLAEQIAQTLPAGQRDLFLAGCRLRAEGTAIALRALQRSADRRAFLDPRPLLGQVRCPVTLVHGVEDDVIHHSQLDALQAGLTGAHRVRALRTGLYGHSASNALPRPAALAREVRGMLHILDGIVATATDRHPGWRPLTAAAGRTDPTAAPSGR